ncbi:MAG: hypothetical protein MUO52_11760 [Desulfobacterales bacterium]|nr:hypothetical protein [Desulfobacterales bacterium]
MSEALAGRFFLYAASLHPRRWVQKRTFASLWLEGNAAPEIPVRRGDDALMVDQG